MPELPEVETLRRDLVPVLVGRTVTAVELRLPKIMTAWGGLPPEALVGRRIETIERRAKILIFRLDAGFTLLMHLKLSGQLAYRAADGSTRAMGGHPTPTFEQAMPHKSTHLILTFDDGSILYFTDIRQFGRAALFTAEDAEAKLAAMKHGPEPFDPALTLDVFRERMARRPVPPIKRLLLDQSFVVGLGNIYANEALGEAELAPTRPTGSLTPDETARLFTAVQAVLSRALTEGIADLERNRSGPDGAPPERDFPRWHGRPGDPCPRCGHPIERLKLDGRSCYWCPGCQK